MKTKTRLKMADLRKDLEKRDENTTGKKSELQRRLRDILEEDGEDARHIRNTW